MEEQKLKPDDWYYQLNDEFFQAEKESRSKIYDQSIKEIGRGLFQAREYLMAIMHVLIIAREEEGKTNASISERIVLISCFVQGFNTSYSKIMKGYYAQSAAVVRQEFELITRLWELRENKSKYGKVPNMTIHPSENRKIYGALSDIAHLSKSDKVKSTLTSIVTPERKTISPSLHFKADYCTFLFETHLYTFYFAAKEYMLVFDEMYGEDSKELNECAALLEKALILMKEMKVYEINPKYDGFDTLLV